MKFKNFNIKEKAQIPCCQHKSKMNKEQSYQKTDLVKKLIYIITSVQMEIVPGVHLVIKGYNKYVI